MVYNLSGITQNTTGILSLFQGVNTEIMGGWFGTLIIIVVYSIALITFLLSTNEANKALVAASFVAAIISTLFLAVNLVPPMVFFVSLIVLAGSIAVSFKN